MNYYQWRKKESVIGISPARLDLSAASPAELRAALGLPRDRHVTVLSTCPPCTGFSRANPENHLRDDKRNSLIRRSALFAVALSVDVVVMENARELIRGNFTHHYEWFREYLENHGYNVFGKTYMLSRFGLPQIRERAIVIAAGKHLPLHHMKQILSQLIDDFLERTLPDLGLYPRQVFQKLIRQVFQKLIRQLSARHIQILQGIRRSGKSTVFKLMINHLTVTFVGVGPD